MNIKRRWTTPDMAPMRAAVIEALHGGGSLGEVGLDVVDGRLDLRGITLDGDPTGPQGRSFLHGVDLHGVDLSRSAITGFVFRDSQFVDVRFDRAQLRTLSFVDSKIVGCSFEHGKLADGAFDGTSVRATSLRGMRLQRCRVWGADFVDCSFAENTWTRTEPRDSSFVRCDFSEATLKTAQFTGSGAREVSFVGTDFRTARFEGVAFKFADPEGVLWPEDDRILVIEPYVATLHEVARMLEDDDSEVAGRLRWHVERERGFACEGQSTGFWHIDLVEQYGFPGDADFYRAIIAKAQKSLTQ